MNSLDGLPMKILKEFHDAALNALNIFDGLDQGLVEGLVRRCCKDFDEILFDVLA